MIYQVIAESDWLLLANCWNAYHSTMARNSNNHHHQVHNTNPVAIDQTNLFYVTMCLTRNSLIFTAHLPNILMKFAQMGFIETKKGASQTQNECTTFQTNSHSLSFTMDFGFIWTYTYFKSESQSWTPNTHAHTHTITIRFGVRVELV